MIQWQQNRCKTIQSDGTLEKKLLSHRLETSSQAPRYASLKLCPLTYLLTGVKCRAAAGVAKNYHRLSPPIKFCFAKMLMTNMDSTFPSLSAFQPFLPHQPFQSTALVPSHDSAESAHSQCAGQRLEGVGTVEQYIGNII